MRSSQGTAAPSDRLDRAERVFREINHEHLASWLPVQSAQFESTLAFVHGRFAEGRRLVGLVRQRMPDLLTPGSRVLDLGSGNGGVALPFAAVGHGVFETHAVDVFRHRELAEVLRKTGLEIQVAVGVGEQLPYTDACFDLVLYLETVEHVAVPRRVGREICRILRPDGRCLVTTPPRLCFALRPDPHYFVRGLVMLPNSLQRWIVERIARKGTRYEVTHLYWTSRGVLSTLPGLKKETVLARHGGWSRLLSWDLIVARKR